MENDATVTFGPFRLDAPIGRGGMGAVYRGEHRKDGRRVAVKVMTSELTRRGEYRAEFRREAQALAKLHHPAIARVVDYGVVDETIADQAPDAIVEGAPWFAMEFVEGRPLPKLVEEWEWGEVEQFLLVLLDALAHAHANDVVHRDLKPSNILIADTDSAEMDLKLVDFGIAHLFDAVGEEGVERAPDTWGTPEVMAPEQIRGEWRNQGPWTDLYAVGCVAWWLVCHRIPFSGEERADTYLQHISGETGPFRPEFEVPGGLERWLRRMLAVDRRTRFQRAADAAYALVRISQMPGESRDDDPARRETGQFSEDSLTALETGLETGDSRDETSGVAEVCVETAGSSGAEAMLEIESPPIPNDWERTEEAYSGPAPEAGLSLFDVRKIPLIDREYERDQLWRALQAVQRTQQPVARLLRGPAGSGKSRLAEWVARRGHELGALTVMKATHTPMGGPRDGLGPMIARRFRCAGLGWSEGFERIRAIYESLGADRSTGYHDAVGLARMMGLDDDQASPPPGFQNPREKHLALRRLLANVASRRPLLLWLDDVAWGWESTRFAEFLLRSTAREPLPILIVLTARDNAIEDNPRVGRMLETIRDHEFGGEIPVRPLDHDAHRELVEHLLHFDEDLVEDVVARTEGHPLFAIQLVGDWVEREVLTAGSEGFVLRRDAEHPLPDGPHELWDRRIRQVLAPLDERHPEEGRKSMELAAALGRHVDSDEWRAVCGRAEVALRERLVEQLVAHGLARREPAGWSFVHSMLVESLEREARDASRWRRWHRICAAVIEDRYPNPAAETAGRRAEHLVEAAEWEAALEPLLEAARKARELGRHREHRQYLERRAEILDYLGCGPESRARVRNWLEQAALARNTGESRSGRRLLEQTEQAARQREWPRILGDALRMQAQMARDRGAIQRCLELAEEAEEPFRRTNDTSGRARCQMSKAQALLFLGEFSRARAAFRLAKSLFESDGGPRDVLRTETWVTYTFIYEGDYETSRERARRVLERARELGDKSTEADVWNQLGECARFEREWGEARRFYQRAAQEYGQVGYRGVSIAEMNMGMVEVAAGRFEQARRELSEVGDRLEEMGLRSRLPHVHAGLLAAAAGLGDWAEFDELLARVVDQCERMEGVSKDTAWLIEQAARAAEMRGDDERLHRLSELARRLREAFGADDESAGSGGEGPQQES